MKLPYSLHCSYLKKLSSSWESFLLYLQLCPCLQTVEQTCPNYYEETCSMMQQKPLTNQLAQLLELDMVACLNRYLACSYLPALASNKASVW